MGRRKRVWVIGGILLLMIGTSQRDKMKFDTEKLTDAFRSYYEKRLLMNVFGEKRNLLYGDRKDAKWCLNLLGEQYVHVYEEYHVDGGGSSEETMQLALEENEKQRTGLEEFVVNENGEVAKKGEKEEKKEERTGGNTKDAEQKKNTTVEKLRENLSVDYLLKNFYIVDSTTSVDKDVFDVKKMLTTDYSIHKREDKKPQILIYHTHGGTEYYDGGNSYEDSVIAVGAYLAEILEKKYGYGVLHDEKKYDYINGKMDRNKAYTQSLKGISATLQQETSIQVLIDLHRDGVSGSEKKLTKIQGKSVAQFMIFNGLSRNREGEIAYLHNPNLQDNLAFGIQTKLRAMELYPDLTTRNYLKGYRYNMHLCKRFLLIELGNQNNTVQEAKNTMPYLAEILNDVLSESN